MTTNKYLAIVLASGAIISTSGCSSDSDPDTEVEGITTTCDASDTHLYVINYLDAARRTEADLLPGFNLDDVNSVSSDAAAFAAGCNHEDGTSPLGEVGVDNQLSDIVPALEETGLLGEETAGEIIARQIVEGDLLVLAEVSGVDSFSNDSCVTISLLVAEVPGGGTPAVGEDGRLVPGQTFSVLPSSFSAGGEPLVQVQAEIQSGTLLVERIPEFRVPLSIGDVTVELVVRNVELEADISASGIANGVLGGGLRIDEVIDGLGQLPELGESAEATARIVLEPRADLEPNSEGACQSISAALVFSATTARTE